MNDSIWSVDALKEYLDSQLSQMHDEIVLRIFELHREHDKFELSVKESMVKQNEFRGALSDLGKTMATRIELDGVTSQYSRRLERTESIQARIVGALILTSAVLMPAVVLVTYFISH